MVDDMPSATLSSAPLFATTIIATHFAVIYKESKIRTARALTWPTSTRCYYDVVLVNMLLDSIS
jgi:hypothetical protein